MAGNQAPFKEIGEDITIEGELQCEIKNSLHTSFNYPQNLEEFFHMIWMNPLLVETETGILITTQPLMEKDELLIRSLMRQT